MVLPWEGPKGGSNYDTREFSMMAAVQTTYAMAMGHRLTTTIDGSPASPPHSRHDRFPRMRIRSVWERLSAVIARHHGVRRG
jgi:hypothetical protein